jgi:hypothetical protein
MSPVVIHTIPVVSNRGWSANQTKHAAIETRQATVFALLNFSPRRSRRRRLSIRNADVPTAGAQLIALEALFIRSIAAGCWPSSFLDWLCASAL